MNREELLKNAKPILFSTSMVKAILDGKKTQTRRVIKIDDAPENWKISIAGTSIVRTEPYDVKLPRYAAGDILWVRETWRIGAWNEDIGCIAVDYKADNYARREWIRIEDEERFERYWIESTNDAIKAGVEPDENGEYHWEPRQAPTKWRPSIFMPREVARIFLRVTNVRVERLQNISFDDAIAEGMGREGHIAMGISCPESEEEFNFKRYPERLFRRIWDNLNAKRGLGWDRNPWV